jgi:transcriptional antiterminator NusG
MDNTDENKKDETITTDDSAEMSLDDMMSSPIPEEEQKPVEVTVVDAPEEDAAETEPVVANESETIADEIQDSPEAPVEETEVVDPAPNEETSTEEATDMIEEAAADTASETEHVVEEKIQPSMPAPKVYRGKWYIVHTYSGHENKVAKTLMQRVQAMGFEERIFDALVPTRDTIRVRGGKKETIKEKIFPGYILVNMDLSDEAWVLVRTTPGVTSFVGAQNKPTPIRDDEVQAIVAFVGQKDPVYKAQFSNGEAVKITDGPFSDFLGTVESIDEAKGKIKVLVSIFGRETPVELDFLQVAKI